MKQNELQQILLNEYNLGAYFCRTSCTKGGVCTYVHKSLNLENLDLEQYCTEKDFEVCAVKLDLNITRTCVITIYRAPSGNFNLFINKLDTLLSILYNLTLEYIICSDINIDYLVNSDRKKQLETLLKTYNLTGTVNFPTRSQKTRLQPLIILSLTWRENKIALYTL